jgi:hypothetical protein
MVWRKVETTAHNDEDTKLVVSAKELRDMLRKTREDTAFMLGEHFTPDNIVEIAKSHFPRLEADVAINKELERTRRLLIIVAAVCLIVGAALVVFAPAGKEGVSYAIAATLVVLPLGAAGIHEFRIRTIGMRIEAGEKAVSSEARQVAARTRRRRTGP